MQTKAASEHAGIWSTSKETAHKKRIKEINAKLKSLNAGGNSSGGGQLTKKEKIAKAQRELQALESKKQVARQQNRWTSADESKYKAEKQKIQARLKKLGASGGSSGGNSKADKIKNIKYQLQMLASKRTYKEQQKTWTKADQAAYTKKETELRNKLKKLQSQ